MNQESMTTIYLRPSVEQPTAPAPQVPGQPALRQRDLWTMSTHDLIVFRDLSPYPKLEEYLSILNPAEVIEAFPAIPP
jgi:hypothetical protein